MQNIFTDDKGNFSKGKTAGTLLALAAFLTASASFLSGTLDANGFYQAGVVFLTGIGIFSLRENQ